MSQELADTEEAVPVVDWRAVSQSVQQECKAAQAELHAAMLAAEEDRKWIGEAEAAKKQVEEDSVQLRAERDMERNALEAASLVVEESQVLVTQLKKELMDVQKALAETQMELTFTQKGLAQKAAEVVAARAKARQTEGLSHNLKDAQLKVMELEHELQQQTKRAEAAHRERAGIQQELMDAQKLMDELATAAVAMSSKSVSQEAADQLRSESKVLHNEIRRLQEAVDTASFEAAEACRQVDVLRVAEAAVRLELEMCQSQAAERLATLKLEHETERQVWLATAQQMQALTTQAKDANTCTSPQDKNRTVSNSTKCLEELSSDLEEQNGISAVRLNGVLERPNLVDSPQQPVPAQRHTVHTSEPAGSTLSPKTAIQHSPASSQRRACLMCHTTHCQKVGGGGGRAARTHSR